MESPPMSFSLPTRNNPDLAKERSMKGGKATAATNKALVYIEGQPHTHMAVASKLAINQRTLRDRIKKLRTLGVPITWERLA